MYSFWCKCTEKCKGVIQPEMFKRAFQIIMPGISLKFQKQNRAI